MHSCARSGVQLTGLLRAWSEGDSSALDVLTPMVYEQLHELARQRMLAERQGHLLQPSALVNEAFMRLVRGPSVQWQDRLHFFGVASRLMRQILVDFARARQTDRRGNGCPHLDLDQLDLPVEPTFHNLLDLDMALDELAELSERQAKVVELRFFGGLENAEVAQVLGISCDSVIRDWKFSRAWLFSRLQSPPRSTF